MTKILAASCVENEILQELVHCEVWYNLLSAICRGDRGSLGHGVQWDSPYIGNSKKENAIMTSSNKCQGNPPSFFFLSRMNHYSC